MTNKGNKPTTQTIYHENWVMKKEGVKSWESYYGLIRGKWLQFYEKNNLNDKLELRKTLELPPKTQCSLVKRTKKRFPFSINNGMGTYYMKCDTELERYHWIFSILSASLGKDKKSLPQRIPDGMKETEAFKKGSKENYDPKTSPTKTTNNTTLTPTTSPTKQTTSAADIPNKRRQKYAIRNEIRQKRKAKKRALKLGLDPNKIEEIENQKQPEKNQDVLRRTKNVRHSRQEESNNAVTRLRSFSEISLAGSDSDEREEERKPRRRHAFTSTEVVSSVPEQTTAFEIKAMLNPKPKRSLSIGDKNFAFEEDDEVEDIPSVTVQMLDDSVELLPNVIVYDDSYSDDAPSTADTSINSLNGSMLSLSGMSNNIFSMSGNSNNLTSRTFLSSDTDFEQKSISGEILSAPSHQRLNTRPSSPLRPTNGRPSSSGNGRPSSRSGNNMGKRKNSGNDSRPMNSLLTPESLIDRPLTPSHSRPLTPNRSPKHFSRFLVKDETSTA